MRSPCNMYQQRESPHVLVRHFIYIKCMSLKMYYVIQLNGIFRVAILKLSLIFGELKVGFYVLLQDVFSQYMAHSSFMHKLLIAYTDKVYQVGEHYRIQTQTLNRLNFSALQYIRLLFYSFTTLTFLQDILKAINSLPSLIWERSSIAFKYHKIHLFLF